jgi:predicted small metal-binding protein
MVKKVTMLMLALVLTLYFVVPATAKDAKKQKTEMKESGPVKQVACDPACGFVVQSRDEKEIVSIVKQHVKTHHQKTLSEKDVKAKITEVPAK